MITIISGTNRKDSNTAKIARQYKEILEKRGEETRFLNLEGLDILTRNARFEELETERLAPADKFIFVSPEYNGSIPGVLKLMLDNSARGVWQGKKALLVGVSTGRAGNLRGMDHLTGILHHMGVQVHPNKLPISQVDKLMNTEARIDDNGTVNAIKQQIEQFISF